MRTHRKMFAVAAALAAMFALGACEAEDGGTTDPGLDPGFEEPTDGGGFGTPAP